MLPPLNLAAAESAKGSSTRFFSRKRVDGRDASSKSSSRSSVAHQQSAASDASSFSTSVRSAAGARSVTSPSSAAVATPRHDSPRNTYGPFQWYQAASSAGEDALGSTTTETSALDELSMIPREFFVLETNAVAPVAQYPPSHYQSRYSAQKSLWETIVFPALSPQTRQQVLLLRQTLEKMCSALPRSPEQASCYDSHMQVLAYTKEELRVYSICFHELIRQIKCICKEQSELLCEIRDHYDAALARMVNQVHELNQLVDKQQEQIGDLVLQHDHALRANDALVEKALRSQTDHEQAMLRSAQRRRQRDVEDQRDDSSSNDDDDDDGDRDCDDEEERQWRRERRNCVQLDQLHRARKRDALVAENMAAARLQSAYHRYHVRKEQHRLALREEKHIAALDIQRSYRGFKQRQIALHRRAVAQVILRRRKEAAAIELLQANVRAYLLKQKRVDTRESKRSVSLLKVSGEVITEEPSTVGGDLTSSCGVVETVPPEELAATQEPGTFAVCAIDGSDRSASMMEFLNKLGDLTLSISTLQARVDARGDERARALPGQSGDDVTNASHEDTDHMFANNKTLVNGSDRCEGDEQDQLKEKIEEAEALMDLFHEAVRSLWVAPSQGTTPLEPQQRLLSRERQATDMGDRGDCATPVVHRLSQSTSTSSLDLRFLPFDVSADPLDRIGNEGRGDGRRSTSRGSLATVSATTPIAAPSSGTRRLSSTPPPAVPNAPHRRPTEPDLDHNGDFHLDESLWNAELNAVRLDESRASQARSMKLLCELLSTRETKKRFVWLKQLMSDTYDTIVGRLREVPLRSLRHFISTRCALAMSLEEWRRHHTSELLRLGHDADPALTSLSFNMADIIREHFRCQSGLKHLVQQAMDNVTSCMDTFRSADPDVERFSAFFGMERSHADLLFYCVCRHLAAQGDSVEVAAGHQSVRRQPSFHPDTMRELIDLPHALRVARMLFRVDEGESIRDADAVFVEVENPVYKRFQPSAAYDQFEAVLSVYFVEESYRVGSIKSNQSADTASRDLPPRSDTTTAPRVESIARPSNVNQFHSKQFNAVASRSPLVRQRHQLTTPPPRTKLGPCVSGIQSATGGTATERKWVYFDGFVELLLRYRSEMSHFHLFTRWTRELFSSATRQPSASGAAVEMAETQDEASESPPRLLSDSLFVETLVPYSLGPSERELTNIFHNALKQRNLQQWMPPRVFTSVVLLMLRNGSVGLSSFCPQSRAKNGSSCGSAAANNLARQGQSEDKRWMQLARKWRSYESEFEKAVEGIYETPDGDTVAATRLLELRNELFQLFIASSGMENLKRAEEIVEQIMKMATTQRKQDQVHFDRIDLTRAYHLDSNDDSDKDSEDSDEGNLVQELAADLQNSERQDGVAGADAAWNTDTSM